MAPFTLTAGPSYSFKRSIEYCTPVCFHAAVSVPTLMQERIKKSPHPYNLLLTAILLLSVSSRKPLLTVVI